MSHERPTISVALAVAFSALAATPASSQDSGSEVEGGSCHVNPGVDDEQRTFGEKLDDCDGILIPPSAGDTEMVEPAPDVGKTRVIRPGELPSQQSGPDAGEFPPVGNAANSAFNVQEIVDAIGKSADTAQTLRLLAPSEVRVRDISHWFSGASGAAIDSSMAAHREDLDALRKAIASNTSISEALANKGLSVAGVIAAQVGPVGAVTIFAR